MEVFGSRDAAKDRHMKLENKTFWNRLKRKLQKTVDVPQPKQAMRELRIGIVGAGNVVRWKYVPQLKQRPYLKVMSVFDQDAQAARSVADSLQTRVVANL